LWGSSMAKASGPLEITIVRDIVKRFRALPDSYARKTHGSAYSRGWPDVIACYRGRMFALEVKRPGGKASLLQLREVQRWHDAGAIAGVVTSWDEVRKLALADGLFLSAEDWPVPPPE